ncbi:PAS domain-containing protein [Erythrobacter sp. W53]|uniref:PAS domain-containing protein n=1 Tax=Erythrobacter sp. W53 TaxID=3425947 RepID=UPI003D767527
MATQEAQDEESQLRFMLDSVPDIAWSADPGPEFTHFNARWREVTGSPSPKEVDDWRKFIHPEDFEASWEKFGAAIQNSSDFEDEWRLRQANGSYRWVLSRAVPSTNDPETARWFGTITDIDDRYREAEKRELLAQELSHRMKNIFAVVSGLIAIRARGRDDVSDFADELAETIQTLNTAHDYVRPDGEPIADQLHALIKELLAPYEYRGALRSELAGVDLPLQASATTPMALVIHELATNSAKYGALSDGKGRITVDITREREDDKAVIKIVWREFSNVEPPSEGVQPTGFGSTLLRMSIASQLGGSFTREFGERGIVVSISIPEDRLSAAAHTS